MYAMYEVRIMWSNMGYMPYTYIFLIENGVKVTMGPAVAPYAASELVILWERTHICPADHNLIYV